MGCGAMMKSIMEVLLLLMLFFTAHAKEKSKCLDVIVLVSYKQAARAEQLEGDT